MLTLKNTNQEIPLTPLKRGKLDPPFSRGLGGFLDLRDNYILKVTTAFIT